MAYPIILKTVLLLIISNCFMTYAWYGHLRTLGNKPWIIARAADVWQVG